MRLRIITTGVPSPSATSETVAAEPSSGLPEPSGWRWLVMHFPCLEKMTPGGRIVVVSDRRHVAEARQRFPGLNPRVLAL